MPHPAWLPALALLAGVGWGAFFPELPRAQVSMALALTWLAGAWAFACRRPANLRVALALGFYAAGYMLAASATRRALDPPIRRFVDTIAASRSPAGEVDAPFIVEGVLSADAAPSPGGATLRMRATHIAFENRTSPTSGGLLITVGGSFRPDDYRQWRAGRRIRAPALLRRATRYLNFGTGNQEDMLARRGVALTGFVKSPALVEVMQHGPWYAEAASTCRARVRSALAATVGRWDQQSEAVAAAILIGDRAGLTEATERRLQEAGTYHVIAISGGNIAIFAGLLLAIGRFARLTRLQATLGTLTGLCLYAYIAGGGSSVVRATLMALVYLAARALDHRSSPLNAIAVAASVVLCASPLSIFDAGFALTFGATLGIVIGVPRVMRVIHRRGGEVNTAAVEADLLGPPTDLLGPPTRATAENRSRWVGRVGSNLALAAFALFAASLAAETALLPLSAWLFGRVTLAGLALNFIAIPLMTVVQVGSLAAVLSSQLPGIQTSVAAGAGYFVHLSASGLIASASLLDFMPWLSFRVLAPPLWVLAVYYGAWAVWLWSSSSLHDTVSHSRMRLVRLTTLAAVTGAVMWIAMRPGSIAAARTSTLRATFLDVGQGDSTLVRYPGGRALMVDTGGLLAKGDYDFGERVLAPAVWGLGLTRIEWLALTHGDPDHMGGAPAVLRNFGVHEIWEGIPVPRFEPLKALARDAAARGLLWRMLRAGDAFRIGEARVRLWHPPSPDWERQRVRNDDSVVLEIEFGDVSLLLTGDIGREIERELAPRIPRARLRVLKVPHHGSRTSSSWEFLAAVRPDLAIFSAGRGNRYGHPAPDVLDRYRRLGAIILRTDIDGAINLETDGRRVWVETFMGRKLTLRAHR